MRQAQVPTLMSILLLSGLAACASGRPILEAQPDPFLIGSIELHSAPYGSAFDAVEELRPLWVRSKSRRMVGGPSDITVYLDRVPFGTLHSLHSVPTESIEAIEWMDPATATERWGRKHAEPAIEVRSRR